MGGKAVQRTGHRALASRLSCVVRLWGAGFRSPGTVFAALPRRGGPALGAAAVLTRFVVTDLLETVPQAMLGRRPFTPTKLPITPERHYRVQALYLPAVGVAQWALMGCVAQGVLRLSGERSELARVLDAIGVGMLIPMPALWASDTLMLATDTYRLPGLAVTHSLVQLWEAGLFSVGLHAALGVPWRPAVMAGAAAGAVYVPGGARFIR